MRLSSVGQKQRGEERTGGCERAPKTVRGESPVWTVVQVAWVGVWLCGVPFWLRWYPLPCLLARLTPAGIPAPTRSIHDLQRVVPLMVRVCQLRLFHLPLFPRACLRQSLALYYLLSRLGYAVTIHFGVRKEEDLLQGHSWVTVQGVPVVEDASCADFQVVYSYPPVLSSAAPRETGRGQGDAAGAERRERWNRGVVRKLNPVKPRRRVCYQRRTNSPGRSQSWRLSSQSSPRMET